MANGVKLLNPNIKLPYRGSGRAITFQSVIIKNGTYRTDDTITIPLLPMGYFNHRQNQTNTFAVHGNCGFYYNNHVEQMELKELINGSMVNR